MTEYEAILVYHFCNFYLFYFAANKFLPWLLFTYLWDVRAVACVLVCFSFWAICLFLERVRWICCVPWMCCVRYMGGDLLRSIYWRRWSRIPVACLFGPSGGSSLHHSKQIKICSDQFIASINKSFEDNLEVCDRSGKRSPVSAASTMSVSWPPRCKLPRTLFLQLKRYVLLSEESKKITSPSTTTSPTTPSAHLSGIGAVLRVWESLQKRTCPLQEGRKTVLVRCTVCVLY